MKKWLMLLLIFLGGIVAWSYLDRERQPEKILLPSPTPLKTGGSLGLAENEAKLMNLSTDSGNFRVAWEMVAPGTDIRVGINQDLEESSDQIATRLNCRVLTSGAFYDTANRPLGLLMSQGATLSAWRANQLLHGLVGWDDVSQKFVIIKDIESQNWDWAVQAGPVLWSEGGPVSLELAADQAARRIVAGVTDRGDLVLMAVVAEDSLYGGPKLVDMANILSAWQSQTRTSLVSVLNLDGGTASAFLSPTLKLKELKPIGSYICIN